MNNLILTDCDGVIIDWLSGFDKFMINNGFDIDENGKDSYNLVHRYKQLKQKDVDHMVNLFNSSRWIEFLEPFRDAQEYILKLHDDGYRFIVITSMGVSKNAAKYRSRNLLKHFGDVVNKLHITEYHHSKKPILEKYEPTIWVEDNVQNAYDGAAVGHDSFLMTHWHNADMDIDDTKITRVNDWSEIYDYINHR